MEAVAQATKTGYLFLFDRITGEPLFPIEERPVPEESKLEGERPWPTQPVPVKPEPFLRQHMDTSNINPYVSEKVRDELKKQLASLNSDHMFEPPSLRGTLMFPGFDGGAEWGGNAYDPETNVLYLNSNEVPWIMTMVPTAIAARDTGSAKEGDSFLRGRQAYMTSCIACHGPDRKGGGNNPSLLGVEDRYSPKQMLDLINSGRRMMPAFNHLPEAEKKAIVNYLMRQNFFEVERLDRKELTDNTGEVPYVMTGYKKFRTPDGYPAVDPPWGTLNAINLSTGEYEWRVPLGEYPGLQKKGAAPTGTENYGGPVVTAGGLVFIAATPDEKLRAFNKRNGRLLWEYSLPAAGFATPSVYEVEGKQYLIIACGGGKLGARSGDVYVAFSLPDAD